LLRYVNNDVVINVKTFWRPFLLFSRRKRETIHKNCSYFKVTRTRTERVLLWTATIRIHAVYPVYPYMATRTGTHTHITVNAVLFSIPLPNTAW